MLANEKRFRTDESRNQHYISKSHLYYHIYFSERVPDNHLSGCNNILVTEGQQHTNLAHRGDGESIFQQHRVKFNLLESNNLIRACRGFYCLLRYWLYILLLQQT